VEDDIKASARLTLIWVCVGNTLPSSYGDAPRPGQRLALSFVADRTDSASFRHVCGTDCSFRLRSKPNQPLHGSTVRPSPPGVIVRPTRAFYENLPPLDNFARLLVCMATRKQQSRVAVPAATGGSTNLLAIGECSRYSFANMQPLAHSSYCGGQQWRVHPANSISANDSGLHAANTLSHLADQTIGTALPKTLSCINGT